MLIFMNPAALFFSTYEWSKQRLAADLVGVNQPVIHIVASSFGEIVGSRNLCIFGQH
jgi:hypothetical protein